MKECEIIPIEKAIEIGKKKRIAKKRAFQTPVNKIASNLLEQHNLLSVMVVAHNKHSEEVQIGFDIASDAVSQYTHKDLIKFISEMIEEDEVNESDI